MAGRGITVKPETVAAVLQDRLAALSQEHTMVLAALRESQVLVADLQGQLAQGQKPSVAEGSPDFQQG